VAENYTALVLLDHMIMNMGYQAMREGMKKGN
jgi:hypothetical protein